MDEVAVCDSDAAEGHCGSVGMILSRDQYLPVENSGGVDQADGGLACDVKRELLGVTLRVISVGCKSGI